MRKLPEDNSASLAGWETELENVNHAIGKDPDKLRERLKSFALEKKLVDSFFLMSLDLKDGADIGGD